MKRRSYLIGILLLVAVGIYASKMTAKEQTNDILARVARSSEEPVTLMDRCIQTISLLEIR
jgi:hypothetical protein